MDTKAGAGGRLQTQQEAERLPAIGRLRILLSAPLSLLRLQVRRRDDLFGVTGGLRNGRG